jgi:hypothetical protein
LKFPWFAPSVVLGVALSSANCKPSVGSSCEPDESRCLDRTSQLSCNDGHFIQTPCKGPGGCAADDKGVRCDISGNQPGDPCSRADEGAASCVGPRMIVCRGGKYGFAECRGEKGCSNEAGRALCDTSVAIGGDSCVKEGLKACSTDGKQAMSCKAGKMQPLYACRGEAGCSSAGGKVSCDTSIADIGDVCDASGEGKNACSTQRDAILVCRAAHFALDEKCKRGTKCNASGGSVSCDKPQH